MPVRELQPVPGPLPEDVARGEPLADDPLEALLEGGLEQHRAVVVRIGDLPRRVLQAEAAQDLAPLPQRLVAHVLAVDPHHVEDHVRRRQPVREPGGGRGVAHVHPVLEHPEVGEPAVVERDHLAVDQQVAVAQRAAVELGPGHRDRVLVAAEQPRRTAAGGVGEHPHTVPLHLVRPAGIGRHVGTGRREHRAHGLHPCRSGDRWILDATPVTLVAGSAGGRLDRRE